MNPHHSLLEPTTPSSISSAEIPTLKNEVLRSIGRNLLLLQQIEGMLKCLVAKGSHSGYVSELPGRMARHEAKVNGKSMGQLVGDFVDNHLGDVESSGPRPADPKEPWLSFRFQIEMDPAAYAQRKAAMGEVVEERNELVHHFLPRWDSNSLDSTCAAQDFLDRQRDKAMIEFTTLQGMVTAFKDACRVQAEVLASDVGQKFFEHDDLRFTPLVLLLGEIVQQLGRADGCVYLNTAGVLLRQHAPNDYKEMRKRTGHKNLKALILATGLFDIVEETTEKGGVRILYRFKPGVGLEFVPVEAAAVTAGQLASASPTPEIESKLT
jgi:hypothetical protein